MKSAENGLEGVASNMTDEQKEQWQSIRDSRIEKLQELRNVMLNLTMTFLGISIPIYWNFKDSNNLLYMKIAIILAGIAALMLFIAQRKCIRQIGEIVEKYPFAKSSCINASTIWYEELCIRFWGIPFLLMIVFCFLAVFQ